MVSKRMVVGSFGLATFGLAAVAVALLVMGTRVP